MAKNEYRRRTGSDTWHFDKDCSNYPKKGYTVYKGSKSKPSYGELDNQCKAKKSKK